MNSEAASDEENENHQEVIEGSQKDQAAEQTSPKSLGDSETSVAKEKSFSSDGSISIPEAFGRYAIQKVLGQGAMGAVYLAKDTQLDRDVALKIPKFGEDKGVDSEEMLERFYREARAAATLRSPNICPVYDVGEIDGQHYITMAYIEGRPLRDFTKSKKSHSEKQIITTIRKLALGLAEAHEIGVVHRDLKLANIMVDKKAEPVVMDFGLARRSASEDVQVTHSGAILGTPAYMSPEQVSGDQTKIGPQTDIYALGVIMYELMTGEMPFRGNLMAILQQIALNNPTKPSDLREGLDPRLEKICLKMMAGEMKKRYQTMEEVAKDLQTCLRKPAVNKKQVSEVEDSKPSVLPSPSEESNPELISVKQSDSLASQLKNRGKALPPRRNSKAAKQSSASSGMNLPPTKWLLAGGLGGVALLLGIFFFARVGKYDVQIVVDDPAIKISIDGEVLNIEDGDEVIRLSAGEHKLKLEKEGLSAEVEEFTVQKNGTNRLQVKMIEGLIAVLKNGEQPEEISIVTTSNIVPSSATSVNDSATPTADKIANGQTTIKTTTPLPAGSKNLLQMVDLDKDYVHPQGKGGLTELAFRDSVLHHASEGNKLHGVIFPHEVNANYDLNIQYEQRSFYGNLQIALPIADRFAVIDLKRNNAVLANLATPQSPAPAPGPIKNSQRLTVSLNIQVRSNGSDATLLCKQENQTLVEWTGKVADFLQDVNRQRWNASHPNQLALLFFDISLSLEKVELRESGLDSMTHSTDPPKVASSSTDNVSQSKPLVLREQSVLSLEPGDGVVIDSLNDETDALTMECWVQFLEFNSHLFLLGTEGRYDLRTGSSGQFAFLSRGRPGAPPKNNLVAGFKLESQTQDKPDLLMNHIAIVRDPDKNEHRFYVNGRLVAKDPDSYRVPSQGFQICGKEYQYASEKGLGFKGYLDEIRISSNVRYQGEQFTPQTRFSSDSETLALYHCDEMKDGLLLDSSGRGHDGKVTGATIKSTDIIISGQYSQSETTPETAIVSDLGVAFESTDQYALIEDLEIDFTKPFTMEMWCEPFAIEEPKDRMSRDVFRYGPIAFSNYHGPAHSNPRWQFIVAPTPANSKVPVDEFFGFKAIRDTRNARQHIAIQWTGNTYQFFLDGKEESFGMITRKKPDKPIPALLKDYHASGQWSTLSFSHAIADLHSHPFHGRLEQFRISRGQRYNSEFTPERLASDEQTIALYNFDAIENEVLKDFSDNHHHGIISGVK